MSATAVLLWCQLHPAGMPLPGLCCGGTLEGTRETGYRGQEWLGQTLLPPPPRGEKNSFWHVG